MKITAKFVKSTAEMMAVAFVSTFLATWQFGDWSGAKAAATAAGASACAVLYSLITKPIGNPDRASVVR